MGRDLITALGFELVGVNEINVDSELNKILIDYQDLFDGTLGCYTGIPIDLEIEEGVKPIFVKPQPMPFAFKNAVDEEIDRLIKLGMLELVPNNEWGTPLVPILKSNGKLRVCTNYKRTINKYLKDVKRPIPRIEELYVKLRGGQKFTKLDMSCAYNQFKVSEKTSKLLAWSTHKGIYLVKRLCFGAKPAVAIFQNEMEKILLGAEGQVNFLDDIVVTGATDVEHMKNLKEVLNRIKKAGLKLNLDKYCFFEEEIRYLGHIINGEGLHMDKEKLKAMLEIPIPKTVDQVRAFIGMVNYYGKFVPDFSTVIAPL